MLFPMILHLSSVNLRLMSSKPLLIGLAFSSQAVLIFKLFSNPRFHGKNPEFERFHLVLPLVWIPRHVSLLLVLVHQPKKKKKEICAWTGLQVTFCFFSNTSTLTSNDNITHSYSLQLRKQRVPVFESRLYCYLKQHFDSPHTLAPSSLLLAFFLAFFFFNLPSLLHTLEILHNQYLANLDPYIALQQHTFLSGPFTRLILTKSRRQSQHNAPLPLFLFYLWALSLLSGWSHTITAVSALKYQVSPQQSPSLPIPVTHRLYAFVFHSFYLHCYIYIHSPL